MNSRWNKLSEMFPCEQPPQDSYVPPPPPTSPAILRRLGKTRQRFNLYNYRARKARIYFCPLVFPRKGSSPVGSGVFVLHFMLSSAFWPF
jgi:hypothetical protein